MNALSLLDSIKQRFQKNASYHTILHQIASGQQISITGALGSAPAFLISLFSEEVPSPLVCIQQEDDAARSLADELKSITTAPVLFFPALSKHRWNEIGPPASVIGRRLSTIKAIKTGNHPLVITSAEACLEKIASAAQIQEHTLTLTTKEEFYFDLLVEYLVDAGYSREERVDQPGDMSVRGGIIDIYMYDALYPVRIEFFGDVVDSIRQFNVETQQSIQTVQQISFIPLSASGRPGPMDEERINELDLQSSILDFFSSPAKVFAFDYQLLKSTLQAYQKSTLQQIEKYQFEKKHAIDFHAYFLDASHVLDKLDKSIAVEFSTVLPQFDETHHLSMQVSEHYSANLKQFKKDIETKSQPNALIAIVCDSESQTKRMQTIAADENFLSHVRINTIDLAEGFLWPEEHLYIYTNQEIFDRKRLSKLDSLETRSVSFRELLEYKPGDFVVHTDYGIGIYRGLKHIHAYNRERECLIIEYKDNDVLYVPLEKMDCVQKYSSRDSTIPSLSKLGGNAWQRLKTRAKKNVKEIAEQLVKLYAIRRVEKGYAFAGDTVWQSELEASFQYDETPDQLEAVQAIKRDMENQNSMDRLICGDVGFGKTEVAIRAAFKAINNDKQVALLVPTTVLAQQHFITFASRLKSFPVRVEMLSRFRSAQQQKKIIEDLRTGKIDLIIGTHRLLSRGTNFKDLGLLIIDEEQKFGVLHKEKLKMLKKNVDTLTLTATPIPRTLQMALVGARDMSVINTPPSNRIPIKTQVSRVDKELIREAILHEINRKGQVFFVHNRVQSIYAIANMLRDLLPQVSFAIAHGQMKAEELERVMIKFTNGEIQCLITTMIIESGIDMPNANTMIINRADRFGLAQLYQLRGRVGRSNQQAFVYLLIPPLKRLTRTAIKRLQSIQEYSHLGSGYKIAMRDLEIRGAGNIFGAKQSGFVDALGYELYRKIIEEAIHEIKREHNIPTPAQEAREDQTDSKVLISTNAYLPEDYVKSSAERVDLYKRLAATRALDEITNLQKEVIDRFGPLPKVAQNLFDYISIKVLSKENSIAELSLQNHLIKGKFNNNTIPAGDHFKEWITRLVKAGGSKLELEQTENQLSFSMPLSEKENELETMKNFLQRMT
jgi:transcription-repair coupling factor (superfamily II helicase)